MEPKKVKCRSLKNMNKMGRKEYLKYDPITDKYIITTEINGKKTFQTKIKIRPEERSYYQEQLRKQSNHVRGVSYSKVRIRKKDY